MNKQFQKLLDPKTVDILMNGVIVDEVQNVPPSTSDDTDDETKEVGETEPQSVHKKSIDWTTLFMNGTKIVVAAICANTKSQKSKSKCGKMSKK